ncbi:vancomycin B-type resistance protein VanW [Clostridium sp. BL-8]|nr:vancomycin B-type resistance protein VanW [Clostridium sp. BL-8]
MGKIKNKRAKSSKIAVNALIKIAMVIIAFIVVGAAASAVYSMSIKNTVKAWENKIYPGITVQGVNIGGMTKEEAKNKLVETFETVIPNKKVFIAIGEKQYELIYSDISPKYNIDETIEQAYRAGKVGGTLKKFITIKGNNNTKNKIPLNFSYDEEKLKAYEKKIQSDTAQAAKDATLSINGSSITVNPEQEGVTVNLEALDEKLRGSIDGEINPETNITVEVEKTKPRVTKEDLAKIKGLMGTFSTSYATSPLGRCKNIEIATATLNGTVVMPGEVFSFNGTVGQRTTERGYQEAGTFVGNKIEPGIGGGICQVSTTLYRAVMKANLRSVERTNHSMAVGYTEPGLDATVAYGYLDYKFKNTYDFPIYIQGITRGKALTYNVYGDPSALNGKTYEMVSEVLETIPPQTKVVPDSSLPEGKEVNEGGGMTGYRTKSYQVTYENGVEINRELISTDTYASVDVIVKKGIKSDVSVGTAAVTSPSE